MERKLSRRDFLRLTLGTASTMIIGCESTEEKNNTPTSTPSPSPITQEAPPTIDTKRLTRDEETIHYRRTLGFTDISPESIEAQMLDNREWVGVRKSFQNNFPPFMHSYGVLGAYLRKEMFGDYAGSYMIHGAEMSDEAFSYKADGHPKLVFLAAQAARDYWTTPTPREWTIQGLYAHEFQHLIYAPWYKHEYPLDIFTKLEHGTYRMLAQVESVKGPLAEDNANWKTNENTPRQLGAQIAKEYLVEKTATDHELVNALEALKVDLSNELKIAPDKLTFNKQNSLLFGRKIIKQIKEGRMTLSSDYKDQYKKLFHQGLTEVYPEMFRTLLTDPSLIQYNPEIISGAQEIMSTLRQDTVPLERIRAATLNIPLSIQKLWYEERKKYPEIPEPQMDPMTTKVEQTYHNLLTTGTRGIPSGLRLPKGDLTLFSDYIETFQKVCWKYPELSRKDPYKPWFTFDPQEHLWIISEIEVATDPTTLKNYLKLQFQSGGEPLRPDYKDRFTRYTNNLQKFIQSPGFTT